MTESTRRPMGRQELMLPARLRLPPAGKDYPAFGRSGLTRVAGTVTFEPAPKIPRLEIFLDVFPPHVPRFSPSRLPHLLDRPIFKSNGHAHPIDGAGMAYLRADELHILPRARRPLPRRAARAFLRLRRCRRGSRRSTASLPARPRH